jgi:excisionase family DNA binding protein
MTEELYTVLQAAEYLQVCEKTIRRLINSKTLAASKVGKSWRIKKSDIDNYLNTNSNISEGDH